MKKLFFLIFACGLGVIIFGAKPAQAKVWLLDTTASQIIILDNQISLQLLDWDQTSSVWGVELVETDQPGVKKLGIYPSTKAVKYRLAIIGGPKLLYQPVNQPGIGWQDLDNEITVNKILLSIDAAAGETAPILASEIVAVPTGDNVVSVKSANPQVSVGKVMAPVSNGELTLISSIYQISQASAGDEFSFRYQPADNYSKSIYWLDRQSNQWNLLSSYNDFPEKIIAAKLLTDNMIVAIFADQQAHDGIASFYDQSRYRYFNYQSGNFTASRDYPKGTKLKVTRLKTGQSIIVEVNDYGPELATGRLIDLDTSAFKQIGSTSAGLIYVKVELYDQD